MLPVMSPFDTMPALYLIVPAGRLEGAALPTVLNKKSRLKRKTTWGVDQECFIGQDELTLRENEFDEELFYKEAIAMVYTIVRLAHSMIFNLMPLEQ